MEEGTTGYDLINGKTEFKLNDMIAKSKVDVKVQCKVNHFDISAHAMHNELCNYISQMKPGRLVLVHGDEPSLRALAESVKQHTGEIIIPANGNRIDLEQPSQIAPSQSSVDIPISPVTSLVFPRSVSLRVRHMGKDRYMKVDDIKSLTRSA